MKSLQVLLIIVENLQRLYYNQFDEILFSFLYRFYTILLFLYGDLQEKIYVEELISFVDQEMFVCKMHKLLDSLIQYSQYWWDDE